MNSTRTRRVRPAQASDISALTQLECVAFSSDRISRRSWVRLVASPSAAVMIAASAKDESIEGAIVILHRQGSSVARIYSVAVSPAFRGQGVAASLMSHAIEWARSHGSAIMRLETRADNLDAQALFGRLGFVEFDRRADYYEDGAQAIRYQKYLWDEGHAGDALALHSPFYGQTLDFTCGPCALMMAMAALDRSFVPDQPTEIRLWREATTVFLAAGHGGCGPFGLAAAAIRRGFNATIYAPKGQTLFIDSVRDDRKKAVIEIVEADFRADIALTGTPVIHSPVSPQKVIEHLAAGSVPVVLISLWRMHGEKGPHWVVVTGFDGAVFRVLDPMAVSRSKDPGISVSVDEFRRITRYGRHRQTAAVVLSKGI
jgi:ribosomal protein S18 acetylase RimI-like enzyme